MDRPKFKVSSVVFLGNERRGGKNELPDMPYDWKPGVPELKTADLRAVV